MQVSLLTTLDPLIRDVVSLSLSDSAAILEVSITPEGTDLALQLPSGEITESHIELSHPCVTCSIRHAVIPLLEELADVDQLLLALPPTIESIYVAPALAEYLDEQLFVRLEQDPDAALSEPFILTSVVTALDAASLPGLLHSTPLISEITLDDEHDTGEVLFSNLAHADVICTFASESTNTEATRSLIEHVNPEARLLNGLEQLTGEMVFGREHDVDAAIMRVHPVWVPAAKNMGDGVWTEVLESPRPLDPERLADTFDALATDGLLIRGCYWLPNAPDEIVTWNSSGTSLTVGGAGTWEGEPMTRLVITGTGTPPSNLHRAFGEALAGAIYRY